MDWLNLVWWSGDILEIRIPTAGVLEVFLISLLTFILIRRLVQG